MIWWGFISFLLVLVALDLYVFNRREQPVRRHAAISWSLGYLIVALIFNALFYYARSQHSIAIPDQPAADPWALEFLTVLLFELVLGLDTIFLFNAIFAYFGTPPDQQRRILLWGMPLALLVRFILIFVIGAFAAMAWFKFVLAAFLLLAAMRMLLIRQENLDPEKNFVVRLLNKIAPLAETAMGPALLKRAGGSFSPTPVIKIILVVETADAFFAGDSVPAAFAVTDEPFIIFAAHAFALLCFRSLYFAVRDLTGMVRLMKVGLAMLLGYAAITVALPQHFTMPTKVTLMTIVGTMAAASITALALRRPGPTPDTSPLGPEAERIARLTLRQSRRLVVLVMGISTVIVGLIMLVGPGPGLLVIPLGLALLASEFIWARRLLDRYQKHAAKFSQKAGDVMVRKPRPGLVPWVWGGTIAILVAVPLLVPWPTKYVLPAMLPVVVFVGIWTYTTLSKHRALMAASNPATPDTPPASPPDVNSVSMLTGPKAPDTGT